MSKYEVDRKVTRGHLPCKVYVEKVQVEPSLNDASNKGYRLERVGFSHIPVK